MTSKVHIRKMELNSFFILKANWNFRNNLNFELSFRVSLFFQKCCLESLAQMHFRLIFGECSTNYTQLFRIQDKIFSDFSMKFSVVFLFLLPFLEVLDLKYLQGMNNSNNIQEFFPIVLFESKSSS